MKKITLWLFALFTCWQINAQVGIIQNFDSGTGLPAGWTETGGKTIAAAESCAGNSIRDNLYGSSTTGTLVSPNQVAGSNGTDLTVSFAYKIEDWNTTNATAPGWGNIQVQYSTNNGGAWTTFFTINDGNHVVANTCATFVNVIPAASLPNGSDVRLRFLFTRTVGDWDVYIDNISATQTTALPPACTALTTPANGAVNVSNSTISWAGAAGIPTGYRLNVGTSPGGTQVLNMFDAGNVTSYNLGTLLAGTTYYVTVIPYNANGNATGPCTESSFTTCGATTVYPSLEPFNTLLPNPCWSFGNGGDLTAGPATTGATGAWYVDGLGNVGTTGAVNYNLYSSGGNDWVISPQYSIPATGYELKLIAAITNYGATTSPTNWDAGDTVEVLVSSTGLTNWTPLFTYDISNYGTVLPTGSINTLDLDAYSGQTVRFAIRAFEGAAGRDIDFSFDNFEVRLSPTCPDQTGLQIGIVTSTTADVSWDDMSAGGAVAYEYAITTSATPPASGTETTALFYSASGLSPQTVYYLHVRTVCVSGSFYGNWATTSFPTACSTVTSFVQNFDAVTTPALPQCWEKISTTGLANTQTGSPSSAPNTMYMYAGSSTDKSVVKMQPVSNLGAGTHRINFEMRGNFTAGDAVEFGYLTDPMDAATFVPFTSFTASSLTYASYQFAPPAGSYSDYIAFRHVGNLGYSILIDNVKWEALPVCPDQTGLQLGIVSSSTADVSWDDMSAGGAVAYEYAITTSATPPASGTATTATFYAATGLTAQTVYYLHVRSECAGSTYGNWSTVSFTTACAPVVSLPWIENFDSVTTPAYPPCWFEENGDWVTAIASTYNTPHSGANYLRDSWSATNEYMWTPGFDLVGGTSYDFSSWIQGDGFTGWTVDYFVNTTQSSSGATQVGATYAVPGTGTIAIQPYAQVTRSFVPATTGTYYFAFRVNQPSATPWYVAVDDVEVKLSPACPTPSASASGVTDVAANLSWTAVPSAALGYEYVLDNVATDPAGSGTSTVATTYNASGLTQLTTYYFHIRSVCSAGVYSAWSTVSFTTLATPPVNDNCSGAIALTPGATFATNPLIANNVGATGSTETAPGCASYAGGDVWYSAVVPASGSLTFENNTNPGGMTDSAAAVYSGACGALVLIDCDDSSSTAGDDHPLITVTGRTPGEVLYYRVWEYGGNVFGTVQVSAYDASLSSGSFDTSNFVAYPNPVKDILNLSYKSAISNVRVVNLLGQEVLKSNFNANDVQVNMSSLSAGAYIVNITVEDTVHSIKVIKE